MEVKVIKDKKQTTAKLVGRLDTPSSIEVGKEIDALKADAASTIVLDCSEMTYISSSGLRLFLGLRKEAAEKGGKVIVRGINNDIRSVFMMTGFLNLFQIEV